MTCSRVGEEEWPHVTEEEDVYVEVHATVEVKDNEADGVGDLDRSEGRQYFVEDQPFPGAVQNYAVGAIHSYAHGVRVEGRGVDFCSGVFGEAYSVWEVPGFQDDVAARDEWAEALKDRVLTEHFIHCICIDVGI